MSGNSVIGVLRGGLCNRLSKLEADGGNFRNPKSLFPMDYETQEKRQPTAEERAAKKEKSLWDAQKALAERKKADDAFRANFERLKAERLTREQKS